MGIAKKIIVISAINIVDGGALTVLNDLLSSLIKYTKEYNIVILASNYSVVENFSDHGFSFIFFPKSKKNWLFRLYYEYVYFYFLSKRLLPDLWLSLHDITPNVSAKKRFVYCHNPSPFLKVKFFSDFFNDPKQYLFSKLYKYLYMINIHKNDRVIVQQNWIANKFNTVFNIKRIVVAKPSINIQACGATEHEIDTFLNTKKIPTNKLIVCYPSYVRSFKNHKIILKAAERLQENGLNNPYHFVLTIDGNENAFSRKLYKKYKHLTNVTFCGLLNKNEMHILYTISGILAFPSKLETWGLPLTEFIEYKKPIVVASKPYAYETVSNYKYVCYFDPDNVSDFIEKLDMANLKNFALNESHREVYINVDNQIAGWDEFAHWLIQKTNE